MTEIPHTWTYYAETIHTPGDFYLPAPTWSLSLHHLEIQLTDKEAKNTWQRKTWSSPPGGCGRLARKMRAVGGLAKVIPWPT